MGHLTISTTADIYTQVEPTRLNDIRNVLTDFVFNCWIFCAVQTVKKTKKSGICTYSINTTLKSYDYLDKKRSPDA